MDNGFALALLIVILLIFHGGFWLWMRPRLKAEILNELGNSQEVQEIGRSVLLPDTIFRELVTQYGNPIQRFERVALSAEYDAFTTHITSIRARANQRAYNYRTLLDICKHRHIGQNHS